MRLFLFVVIRALTACLLGSSAAAQPLTHQDDLNIDDIPDRLEFELVENPDGMDSQRVKVVDGDTNELIYIFEPPVLLGDGFGADARIGADWTGDGIAEIYISVPLVERWGGYGVVWVYDGVGFDRVLKFDGNVSDIFGLEINEIPDTDGDGWDELVFSSHFIDTDLDVWQEWLELPKGDLGVNPIAEDDPTLFLRGADVDENGIVDLEDLADISSQVGSDDPALDLDTDGTVDAADVTVAAGAWQGGTPVVPNGRLLFWAPDADTGVGTTGEIILKRSTDGGLGGGGSGGGGGGTNGGGGGGGGGGGDDDDDDGGGGGGGGGGGDDDDDDDDGDDDDEDEDETKPRCLFDNPENWIDRESTTNENCVLVLIGQALGKYSAIFPGNGPTRLTFGAVTSESGSAINWSVTGATVENISFSNTYGFSRCTILIEDPGTVTISANVASPCGGLSVQGKTRVLELDLDVDSDNDDSLGSPERDEDEELTEFAHWPTDDTPGKVALTNIFDYDGDGLPGYIDGINMYDLVDHEDDDVGGQDMLVPLVFDVDGPVCDEAFVKFRYAAARPPIGNEDELAGLLRVYEDDEHVRLWLNKGPFRDPRSIKDGGDYIPPNTWISLSEFGLVDLQDGTMAAPAENVTLWIEPVMPSRYTGDALISAELATGITGSTKPRDAVRITATEIIIFGDNNPTADMQRSPFVVKSDLNALDPVHDAHHDGQLAIHSLIILDPRAASYLESVNINGFEIPLYLAGLGVHQTPEFRIADISGVLPSADGPWLIQAPNSNDLSVEYNPSVLLSLVQGSSEQYVEPLINEVASSLDQITLDMKNQNWVPNNPADDGAFGKEVHNRLSAQYAGNSRVRGGMLIDMNTREILVLEGYNGAGTSTAVQVDVVVFDDGYSPEQGDILDPSKAEAIDAKTNNRGRIRSTQRSRLRSVFDNDKIRVLNAKHKWTASNSWHVNPRWKSAAGVATVLGAGVTVWVILQPDQYDARFDDIRRAYEGTLAQPDNPSFKRDLVDSAIGLYSSLTGESGKAFEYVALIEAYSNIQ